MEYEIGPSESVSTAVVCAVSAVVGREPLAMPPLAHVLHPDALDTLFGARPNGAARTGGRLTFVYCNCRITVDNGEYLTIQPLEPDLETVTEREPGCTPSH
ncbi:hypothetical protein GRS48_05605 [Halorubrum sp. JWXQ-INN 858]|uniref:HalOD1 output domain-containing protein n=1 Tax=Halorubrum sp. JWXQ-INN 858 TaxID=2690782 RepID=UPI001356A973|nr:HalOD1 output domain-containing protein [Halorubrum sp. JWXQ-INN 858]MWV64301.1 hypothetical protein [Halorubrum sp. JWXQ-INN 858]